MNASLRVSVVTAVFNGVETIADCIKSVASQTWPDIEHIIIDGGSTDGTVELIRNSAADGLKYSSEADNGIYDAMNKGFSLSTGQIIATLNSDDCYAGEHIIEQVVKCFSENQVDSCYGDLVYVGRRNTDKIVRYWRAGAFDRQRFNRGWMPPHPAFFAKRPIFEQYGAFDLSYEVAADYELMLRLLYKHSISTAYIPKVMVKMRTGGKSAPSPKNTLKVLEENYRAWTANGLKPNLLAVILKPLLKTGQYIRRCPRNGMC